MSSILDALKKLETDKEEQPRSQELDWPQPVNTKETFYESMNRKPVLKPFVAGGVLLLAVAFGGWFVFKPEPPSEPVKPVAEKTEPKPFKAMVEDRQAEVELPATSPPKQERMFKGLRSRHSKRPERSMQDVPPHLSAKPEPKPEPPAPAKTFNEEEIAALSEILPQNTPKEQPDLKAMWDARIKEQEGAKQETLAAAEPKQALEPEPVVIDDEMAELLDRIPKEMLPPVKVVESGWLKLHAISWSDDPSRRIAVINSKLVKEGRKIDGALVSRIARDYVVIERDGEEWMLPFGNH